MFNLAEFRRLCLEAENHYSAFPVSGIVAVWAADLYTRSEQALDSILLSEVRLIQFIAHHGADPTDRVWMDPTWAAQRLVHLWRRTGRDDRGQVVK